MKVKLFCPVCRLQFVAEAPELMGAEICKICGAKVQVVRLDPVVETRKYPETPEEEIHNRVDAFAELRGYVFSDQKAAVMEGLMGKKRRYGDFYCPCRIENDLDTICPCVETRQNRVLKTGCCRCGLFYRDQAAVEEAQT